MTDVQLLVHRPEAPTDPFATTFGGAPPAGRDFTWPICATCGKAMSFLGQVRAIDTARLLLIFMCENDPGMCEEWDADGGGNRVIAIAADRARPGDPGNKHGVVRPFYGARVETVAAEGYSAARANWVERHPGHAREVLGQLGGTPDWLQGDETPTCDGCAKPMVLTAQLETGPDHRTEMNFAGGCGYLFDCACPAGTPKFLWQN